MFLQASVILSTGGGVCLSACWDTTPPRADTPPGSRHPPQQTPPTGADTPQEQTPSPRSRHPTEQTPPGKQTSAYGQQTAGTHPTGMHSCLCSN